MHYIIHLSDPHFAVTGERHKECVCDSDPRCRGEAGTPGGDAQGRLMPCGKSEGQVER